MTELNKADLELIQEVLMGEIHDYETLDNYSFVRQGQMTEHEYKKYTNRIKARLEKAKLVFDKVQAVLHQKYKN